MLRKFKADWENWHGRGVRFNEPVQVQKVESVITWSDCEKIIKKRTNSPRMFPRSRKVWKGGGINTQNDYKTTSKKWADKRKTGLFSVFCKCV